MVNSEIVVPTEKYKKYLNPEFLEFGKLGEYSINKVDHDYTYFKSNDLQIKIMPSGRFGLIDFKPFNQTSQLKNRKFEAIAMFYCGLSNFIYAYEEEQIRDISENCQISNPTNEAMAKFAQQFGFEIDAGREYIVKGDMIKIRKTLKLLKKNPVIERVLKKYKSSNF